MVYRDEVLTLPGEAANAGSGRQAPKAVAGGGKEAKEVEIYIPPGSTSMDVASILERQGIIQDAQSFERLIQAMGASRKLVAGRHRISLPVEPRRLVEQLTKPEKGG
jgi:cell division protein YceG involved in septum cleavage